MCGTLEEPTMELIIVPPEHGEPDATELKVRSRRALPRGDSKGAGALRLERRGGMVGAHNGVNEDQSPRRALRVRE